MIVEEQPEIIEQAAPQPAFESLEAYEAKRSNPKEDTPAAAIETQPTSEQVETTEGSEKAEKPKRDRTAEGRIAELTRKARELEEDRDNWRTKAESAPAPKPEPPQARQQPNAEGKPKLTQFVAELKADELYEDAVERYNDAVADWRDQQNQKRAEERTHQERTQQVQTKIKTRMEEVATKFDDFNEVVESKWAPPAIQSAISDYMTDDGNLEVLYHLAKDSSEVERIAALPKSRQLAELGKLEDRISKPQSKPTAPPVSKAPAPLRNVSGTSPEPEKDPTKASSFEDYQRVRTKR